MPSATLSPYLMFNGNAREAIEFYHDVLGGELKIQTFSEVPDMPAPPGYENKVMHAHLDAGGLVIMASDPQPGSTVRFGDNLNLSLMGTDGENLTRVFQELSDGGQVTMPLARQFWGDTFGSLTDRFGVNWMVNISDR